MKNPWLRFYAASVAISVLFRVIHGGDMTGPWAFPVMVAIAALSALLAWR